MSLDAFRGDLDRQPRSSGPKADRGSEHCAQAVVLPGSVEAPSLARRFAERWTCRLHGGLALSAVKLAVSEMTTQAVRSGDGPVVVALSCRTGEVAASVTYESDRLHFERRLRLADDVTAWIIEGISRATGTDIADGKQRLWCTIPTGVPALPAPRRPFSGGQDRRLGDPWHPRR